MIFSFFLCTAAWSSPGNYKHRSIEQKDKTSLNKLILFFVHITRVWSIFNDNNQHETKRYSTSTRSYWVQGHEILDHRSTIGHDNSIVFDGESDRILAKICTILLATQQQSSMWSNLTWLDLASSLNLGMWLKNFFSTSSLVRSSSRFSLVAMRDVVCLSMRKSAMSLKNLP